MTLKLDNNGRRNSQSGYLLLPVAVAIALIGVIAFLISSESAIEVDMTASELETARAEYVAQAGMQHALREHAQQGCGPYTDLTNVAFGVDEYDTNLTHDLGSTTPYTIPVDQDAWIRNDLPTVNKGADLKLHTRFEGGNIEYPLLRYDLSSIPAKAAILSATAWFYLTNVHPEGPVDLHLITADWAEADATWDSMNANIGASVIASIPAQAIAGTWVPVNLTSQVQAWVNGEVNHGIALGTTSEGSHGQYNSRESANAPWLEVTVGTPPTSPTKLRSTSKLDGGGAAIVERDDVYLRQSPASHIQLVLNDGAGQDVMLDSFYSSRNYGNHEIEVETIGSDENSLIRFDRLAIPPGARINSARLELYHYMTESTQVNPGVELYRVTRDWVEGTLDGTGTADGATWQTWDGSSSWTQNGGDHDVSPVASSDISAAINDWESWEIGELVQGWIDGTYPNYGLLLKGTGSIEVRFASKEDADPALRPRLTISYSCPCGEVCAAPQGSGNLLMVVINPNVLVAEDQQAKDLFESWGYTVSVISESANQSSYDSAVAANDVVFISETVNSNSVGIKLVNAPIGVVSQDGDYNPDLGLAPGASLKVGNAIDIVSTDHYITQPFAIDAHEIYTADMEQAIVTGSLTADQQTLAEIGGDGSLVVLDKGDAMEGGGIAAGRRVILPLGTRYRFNWDHLNASGRLLVQRAIDWGIGAVGCPSMKPLLLVVGNDSPLAGKDDGMKILMESWCYEVTVIDDGASQAEFDAAAAAADVVYVSGTTSGPSLQDKLTGSPTPIVNEINGKLDNFGFSSSTSSSVSASTFTGTNPAHYISEPFSGSAATVFTTSLTMPVPGGTLAPDLQTVGETAGAVAALVTLDTGAQRWDGNPAPARRVHLPFTNAETSQLTADGEILMRRALEWAGGAGCVSMQPLLLVVGDAATLSSKDAGMKTLMESWCYGVTVIDDGASQASFDAAAAAADVVYVSGTTSGPSLQDKLTGSPTPIVNEINGKLDNFGFSSSTASSVTESAFSASNASHYISDPFAGNPVTVFTTDLAMPMPGGTLAPDLQTVGETTGAIPALVTLDAGAQRWDGNPAPARRVHLPFTNAEPGQLTADGQTLMQRALEWAGSLLPGPIAHWKLDETTGPTAVDSEGGHDGTWTNGPNAVPGVIDGGLDFDGSNDYIDVPHDDALSLSTYSISAWVQAESLGGWQIVVSKGNTTSWNYYLGIDGSEIATGFNNAGAWTEFATSGAGLSTGQWYFLAASFDDATGEAKIYLDGVLVHTDTTGTSPPATGDAVTIGTSPANEYWDGLLDDVRIYNRVLGQGEISDLYSAGAPPAAGSYTELYEPWSATSDTTWQTVDLAPFGVPENAVVEVAVVNSKTGKEREGGVRAVGSALERRFDLHEAEDGGIDAVTMHVQADASGRIQHYSERKAEVTFVLLGYWTGATYVERFDAFKAGANASWQGHDLGAYGVGPNQVAEIALSQTSTSAEWQVGTRQPGSGLARQFSLHEAESGGIDMVTLMSVTDASSVVEVYAEADSVVDFHLLGYWSTPPGTYTEAGGAPGQVSAPTTWETIDLSGFGVPADSVAQFVLANQNTGTENSMRVREVGSTINNRAFNLHEAEDGGSDLGTIHASVDASAQVQWSAQQGPTNGYFYPVGWWVLSP